jgi:dihydrofolate reductase
MRKLVAFMHISLDGYTAPPNGEFDWMTYTEELAVDAGKLSNGASAAMYGRNTYQGMESYWPTVLNNPNNTAQEREHAAWVENIHKIVISRTLDKVTWNNTTLIKENVAAEVKKLKAQGDSYILIFGSPSLTHSLAALGLIDEYRVNVHPASLSSGTPLFAQGAPITKLALTSSRTFESGVVGLHYAVVR